MIALGNRKNELVVDLLCREGVDPYEGSVRFVRAARRRRAAARASSPRAPTARDVLAAAGIADLFDLRVDGNYTRTHRLPGKPAPDTFLAAAASWA